MIQSNPVLRDQLLSEMQSSISKISNENQINVYNAQTPIDEQEEVDSDDDNTFK